MMNQREIRVAVQGNDVRNSEEMVFSFHRGNEHLVYEVREADQSSGFELIIHQPDGSETIEHFDSHAAVDGRTAELQRELIDSGWWLAGDPRR